MNVLGTKEINGYRYQVVFDQDAYDSACWKGWDWDSEQDMQHYLLRHQRDELTFVGIIKSKKCECCNSWIEASSLWQIDCEDPYDIDSLVSNM